VIVIDPLVGVFLALIAAVAIWLAVRRADREWWDPPGTAIRRPGGTAMISRVAGVSRPRAASPQFPATVEIVGRAASVKPTIPALRLQPDERNVGIQRLAAPLPPPAGVDENGMLRPPREAEPENERGENP
jgi:hypothetical protein